LIRDWGLGLGWSANRSALVVISSPQSPSPQSQVPVRSPSPQSRVHVDKKTGSELYFKFEQLTNTRPSFGVGTWTSSCGRAAGVRAVGTIRSAVAGLDPSLAIVKLWYLPARAATRVEMIVLRDE